MNVIKFCSITHQTTTKILKSLVIENHVICFCSIVNLKALVTRIMITIYLDVEQQPSFVIQQILRL